MLFQAFAHTFVAVPVAVFWSSVEIPHQIEAFGVFGIASSAAIEQVQAQELALVLGSLLENNRGSQHAVDWPVFKLVEAGVHLLGKKIQIHNSRSHNIILSLSLQICTFLEVENKDQIETTRDQGYICAGTLRAAFFFARKS